MSALVRFLADFCREHPLDEKVFIVPSFVAGRQIGESLVQEEGSWVNLRFVTLPSLAHETAALELALHESRLVAGSELLIFVDTLFREMRAAGRLEYFSLLEPSPGVARALLETILRLRLEGLASERIDPGHFCLAAKGRDIRALLGYYERRLEAARGVDLPGLYSLAAKIDRQTGDQGRVHFLCPANVALSRAEKNFLDAASGGRCVFLGGDPVIGLEPPRLFQERATDTLAPSGDAASDVERLPWLFDPGNAPKPLEDGTLDIFRAVGPTNECREILRRILTNGLALDQVELICPSGPTYINALQDLSLRMGLAMTFADGLPLSMTSPGRILSGLITWIETGYPASVLGRLVESLDLRFPFRSREDEVPPQAVSRHLREAMIGWGRERYLEFLRIRRMKLAAKLHDRRADEESGMPAEGRKGLESDASEVGRLSEAMGSFLSFFSAIPDSGPIPFAGLCLCLASALETCTVLRPDPEERDRRALELITDELRALAGESWAASSEGKCELPALDLEASIDRLRTAASSLSVGAAAPRPGHLHVSTYSSGGLSGRRMTFIMGLEDASFPGRGLQDPFLLDDERAKLSPGLPTVADNLRERLYLMAALLASLRGRVVFSFPSYDILEDRAAFPSSLVLQVHRLSSGDGQRDYASLDDALSRSAERAGRPDPAGFLTNAPENALDGAEWWLRRLAGPGPQRQGLAAVRRHFPDLSAGIKAEDARAGDKLGEYEGVIRLDDCRYDPLRNPELEVSASRLESLVKCPFGYFLRYILGIEPPDELERDLSRWLDPLDRGSLIHEILFEFMTRVVEKGDKLDPHRHRALMEEIAGRIVAAWKRRIPPPSDGIFEKERQDIQAALNVFFNLESARPEHVRPFAFEKAFSGIPVEVKGDRSFLLRGRIDRIDLTGRETFRIIDYKTGNPKPFEDLEAFGKGRVIQHALYAVAVEKLLVKERLARKPRVTESGYSFPTRRGEGREVLVGEFDRQAFRALLNEILSLISKGFFVSTLKDDCAYCDYSPICGGRPAETRRKIKSNEEISETLGRIRSYD